MCDFFKRWHKELPLEDDGFLRPMSKKEREVMVVERYNDRHLSYVKEACKMVHDGNIKPEDIETYVKGWESGK